MMTDADYLAAFEAGRIRPEDFHHRDHLRLAWACLREGRSTPAATARIASLIRLFAAAAGHPGKYHETLTRFWMELLAQVRLHRGDVPFDALIAENPAILDKDFVLRFYPRAVLFSDKARTEWIAPPLLDPAEHAAEAHSRTAARDAWRGPVPGAA
jgi:hypothetical protein